MSGSAAAGTDSSTTTVRPVDDRSLFEKLQEQKAAKEDALYEATKFSNLIRRLDNDELDFLASVKEAKDADLAKRERERQAAVDAFKQAQAKLDALESTAQVQTETKDTRLAAGKRRAAVTGIVKRNRKMPRMEVSDKKNEDERLSNTESHKAAELASDKDDKEVTVSSNTKYALISYTSDSDDEG